MTLRLAIETVGIDDVCPFTGVRKLHRGKPVAFENAFGFPSYYEKSKPGRCVVHLGDNTALDVPGQPRRTMM